MLWLRSGLVSAGACVGVKRGTEPGVWGILWSKAEQLGLLNDLRIKPVQMLTSMQPGVCGSPTCIHVDIHVYR